MNRESSFVLAPGKRGSNVVYAPTGEVIHRNLSASAAIAILAALNGLEFDCGGATAKRRADPWVICPGLVGESYPGADSSPKSFVDLHLVLDEIDRLEDLLSAVMDGS